MAAPRSGFVAGRSTTENSFELEGAFVEYSILNRDDASLLLDLGFPLLATALNFT